MVDLTTMWTKRMKPQHCWFSVFTYNILVFQWHGINLQFIGLESTFNWSTGWMHSFETLHGERVEPVKIYIILKISLWCWQKKRQEHQANFIATRNMALTVFACVAFAMVLLVIVLCCCRARRRNAGHVIASETSCISDSSFWHYPPALAGDCSRDCWLKGPQVLCDGRWVCNIPISHKSDI